MYQVFNKLIIGLLAIVFIGMGCADREASNASNSDQLELKIMTWNIWGRLNLNPRYTMDGKTGRDRVIEIIQESKADIITMTETYGSASDIAAALNYQYYTPSADANLTIFSRYPIVLSGNVKDLSPFSFIAATIALPNNRKIKVYNIWLTSGGRHIVEIKNEALTNKEFNEGDQIRYEHILKLLDHDDFKNDLKNKADIPIVVAGDFNCVSHLDYTPATQLKQLNFSRILPAKTSMAMVDAGFIDSYRFIHPTITEATYGYTWTTVGQGFIYKEDQGFVPIDINPEPAYRDPFARIDYIYCSGEKMKPIASKTIVHHASNLSRSFPEFPSDHGAVLSTFRIE